MRQQIRPFTPLETCELVLVETKNELTKCELMDRVYQRLSVMRTESYNMVMGQNQAKMNQFKLVLGHLEDIHKDLLEKEGETTDTK